MLSSFYGGGFGWYAGGRKLGFDSWVGAGLRFPPWLSGFSDQRVNLFVGFII